MFSKLIKHNKWLSTPREEGGSGPSHGWLYAGTDQRWEIALGQMASFSIET